MHISFILPDLKGGGVQKMIINLANVFARRGYKVDLVLFQQSGVYDNIIDEKVNVVSFNKSKAFSALFDLKKYFAAHENLAVISSIYHVNIVTLLANKLSGSKHKVIVTERNNFSQRILIENKLHQIMYKNLVRHFYPSAGQIVGISDGVSEDMRDVLGARLTTPIKRIYNPVISNDYEEKVSLNEVSIYPEGVGLKLITSGRLVEQKDYPTMIKALKYYRDHYGDDFHLVVLGKGALQSDIEALIEEYDLKAHITLQGFVDNPLSYLKQADMFIMSSIFEGFGNVLVEALYCGLKIVSTDCPSGPAEILENGKYGILTPVGDETAFANAIHEAQKNKPNPKQQQARALDFTAEKIADQFLELVEVA